MNHHHNLFLFIIRSLKLNKCLFVQFIHFEVVFEKYNICSKLVWQNLLPMDSSTPFYSNGWNNINAVPSVFILEANIKKKMNKWKIIRAWFGLDFLCCIYRENIFSTLTNLSTSYVRSLFQRRFSTPFFL